VLPFPSHPTPSTLIQPTTPSHESVCACRPSGRAHGGACLFHHPDPQPRLYLTRHTTSASNALPPCSLPAAAPRRKPGKAVPAGKKDKTSRRGQ
jgi:hypothetical protein